MLADPFAPLGRLWLVPVVEIEDPGAAADLGNALVCGGLPCAEIEAAVRNAVALAALAPVGIRA